MNENEQLSKKHQFCSTPSFSANSGVEHRYTDQIYSHNHYRKTTRILHTEPPRI
ncbi:hypothetical protein XCR1_1980003 [Xenorhabdus cabanillasii JM26]|uniref:Uncharacterized protein n=1 Tax=Xenorhabdus cabanillasii JM26 TaxID=1427517 RepID=W1J3D8_9GAMM|nr:hypothetical protein XCR1_1980003 [Xenorhabdus cabanillasii JM26]